MPRFQYTALDPSGGSIKGEIDAVDAWMARKAIGRLNLSVVKLKEAGLEAWLEKAWLKVHALGEPLSVEERLIFISQLETGFAVGIPVLIVLETIIQDVRNPRFVAALRAITSQVSQGSSLHEAFASQPTFFDDTFVGLIRSGEISGDLERVLGRIFKVTEQQAENRARVKSAMFYPKIVIGFLVFVMLAVVYFVIPRIQTFLTGFGQDLPPITKLVIGVSHGLTKYGLIIWPLAWLTWRGGLTLARTPRGALILDELKLRLPALGSLFLQIELCGFCVILDLLIESGIPITDALTTLARTQSNRVIQKEIEYLRTEVTGGKSLRQALQGRSVFPPSLTGLLSIGEESGRIPEVLRRIGRHYQLQVDYRLNNLSKLIEPILLAVISVFALILALAVFLPIWKMSSAIRPGH